MATSQNVKCVNNNFTLKANAAKYEMKNLSGSRMLPPGMNRMSDVLSI